MFSVGDTVTMKDNDLYKVWPDKFPDKNKKGKVVELINNEVLAEFFGHAFILPQNCFVKVG